MATRPTRRTLLSVEALEDRLVLSSSALLPLAAPQLSAGHKTVHHGGHHRHLRHHVVQVSPAAMTQATTPVTMPTTTPAVSSIPAVSAQPPFLATPNPDSTDTQDPGDQDRRRAELMSQHWAYWIKEAAAAAEAGDHEREALCLHAAANALDAANDLNKAADARDKGDKDKADKLEQADKQREKAERAYGEDGNSAAGQKAEQAASDLENKAK
jgi:hypothetical protein